MSYYLVLVGTQDNPLYETYLTSTKSSGSSTSTSTSTIMSIPSASSNNSSDNTSTSFSIFGSQAGVGGAGRGGGEGVGYGTKSSSAGRHVMQLIAHASLDVVEDVMWSNGGMYLKSIDKFHEWTVSAWLTPGGVKIILLHELKNDEGIKLFLQDTWESYVKTLLNPFHELNSKIRSKTFDQRIRDSGRKHL